jgi:hypothetical protein
MSRRVLAPDYCGLFLGSAASDHCVALVVKCVEMVGGGSGRLLCNNRLVLVQYADYGCDRGLARWPYVHDEMAHAFHKMVRRRGIVTLTLYYGGAGVASHFEN